MTKEFWIWKERLTEVLIAISAKADVKLSLSSLDEIKYGLVGTSDEEGYWFDYKIGFIAVRLAEDNGHVICRITGLDDKSIEHLSEIGTKGEWEDEGPDHHS
jgi:hypothetical protein